MRSIGVRFLLPFGLLAVAFSAFTLHRAHEMSRQHARTLISRQAALALEFNLAIREYAAEHIRPTVEKHVGKDGFARETMSTSFISRSIFEKVREKYPDCIIRFSSDDPRNPINEANSDELRMIEYFRKNPHAGERAEEIQIEGRRYLAHFVPKWVKEDCLRCHGDPKDAPAEMLKQYGSRNSFHRVLGDVAGLDTVAIPLDAINKAIASETRNQALVLLVGLALMTGSVAVLFRATVTRRLAGMARHLSEIAADFDSTRLRPVAVSGADEIGVLGSAFNSLIERLSLAHTLLESRVAARTADLARTNDELKREIAERQRAEQALRASEERYRRITQAVTDYIYHVRVEDGRTVETIHGPACEAVTGYTAEEFAADPLLWIRMVPEEEQEAVLEHVDRARNGSTSGPLEHRIHRKDGDIRWVQNTTVPQHDHDGRLMSYDGLIRDVTERRLAEQALRDSEEKFRAIAEHARVGIGIVQDSKFVYVNPYAAWLTGNAREELLGRPLNAAIHPESLPIANQRLAELHSGTPAAHAELRLQTKGGTERWVEADAVPFVYGNRPAVITVAVDVTGPKRTQEELRRERDFNRTLVQSSPAFFVAIGADGKTVMMNESLLQATGYLNEEVVGTDYLGTIVPEHERESVSRVFEQIIGLRQATRNENHILTRDGRELLVEWHGRPVFHGRDLVYFFGVGIDITERKRAEEDRLRLEAELRQAQKMEAIGTLATGIAHDFNNLLTAISGYTELARSAMTSDHPARQFLDVVDTAVRDASGIAKSLLTFSRKTIVAKAPIDFRRVVQDSLKLLRRILPASITVTEHLPADHPVYTYADIGQLHQVLMNLITNARDAMPGGGTLRISLLEENKTVASTMGSVDDATEAVLVIEDTGVGMSPEVVSRIFDPFFTTKPRGKGTGLGMAMVHGIVEEHNGEVRVESQPGRGARISVRLPCCDPPIPSPDTENTDTAAPIGRGKTVLLAEDEEFVRRIMIETLNGSGFEVVDFTSGTQAMASFEDTPDRFALVVLDIDLPEISGLHCMKEIRKTSPNIPILLVTGEPEVDVDEDQDEHLVVLHKPFKMAQLMSLARILLAEPE